MFESNFPVDKITSGYGVLWNAFKRLASGASAAEKTALFSGTRRNVCTASTDPRLTFRSTAGNFTSR